MITSTSIDYTTKAITAHHGNLSSVVSSRIMDIDSHESHPVDHHKDPDAMDTALDSSVNDERKSNEADPPADPQGPGTQLAEDACALSREGGSQSAMLDQSGKPQARMVQKPHLTQDLLALFNLQPLAATVARVDAEGNKINKMRKSYEGQVKTFGLSGRNRAIKHEPGKLPGLKELTTWPEEEWHNQKVVGKEVHKGLASTTLAKLERAMQMQPGLLPNNNEWEDLLGHEKAKPIITITEQNSRKHSNIMEASVVKPNGLTNGTRTGAGKPASEVPRPKRTNKKRRYDEHSFEGYGEGFVDDEGDIMLGGGYSSGDGSRKSGTSKKRRKDYGKSNSVGIGERGGSYGVGMIGVGSGIGAYGR